MRNCVIFSVFLIICFGRTWAGPYIHLHYFMDLLERRVSDVLFGSVFLQLKEKLQWKLKLWWSHHVDTVLLKTSWQVSEISVLELETPVLVWVPNTRALRCLNKSCFPYIHCFSHCHLGKTFHWGSLKFFFGTWCFVCAEARQTVPDDNLISIQRSSRHISAQ